MLSLSDNERNWLARFVARGWLHAEREIIWERHAVTKAVRLGWLRIEGSEALFTSEGRRAFEG